MPRRVDRWVVVGAGSAGCVAARRLIDAGNEVVLLEAGPPLVRGHVPVEIDGDDALATHALADRLEPGLLARRITGRDPVRYLRGRGVGGSGAINAMVALRGSAERYRSWGWDDTDAAFERVLVPTERALDAELGRVDRLLLDAEPTAVRVPLTRHAGRRITAVESYLWPILDGWQAERLTVRPTSPVDRIEFDGSGAAIGVLLADGSSVPADGVALAAGAIHSPAILQRSGVTAAGSGLRDHPAIGFVLKMASGASGSYRSVPLGLVTASCASMGSVQLLALNHLGSAFPELGMLFVALMAPTGPAGAVTVASDDPSESPLVDFGLLTGADDRRELRAGVRWAAALLRQPPFVGQVDAVFIDDRGTPLDALPLDDDDALDAWLLAHAADYVHAASSCSTVIDTAGDGGVVGHDRAYVCDASAFPDIPDANTHLPTMMLAERLTMQWVGMTGSDHA